MGNSGHGTVLNSGAVVLPCDPWDLALCNQLFGDGADGAYASGASGTTTLARDMYYSAMSWSAGSTSTISTGGYKIYCSGTLNLQNAPANAINRNGISTVASQNGGLALAPETIGGNSGIAGTGGAAGIGNTAGSPGGQAINNNATQYQGGIITTNAQGYQAIAGKGANSGTFAGGTGAIAALPSTATGTINNLTDNFTRAIGITINPYAGGGGGCGGGGGGSGVAGNIGGAGGGGGSGGGAIFISAAEIYRDSSTSASAISVTGGNASNGITKTSGGGGGGGGGCGGAGGWVYMIVGMVSGQATTNLINVSSGAGGPGGNGGTGTPGNGANGGGNNFSGRIQIFGATPGSILIAPTGPLSAGVTGSTGYTGGAGATATIMQYTW
jgi:hypothetical protein